MYRNLIRFLKNWTLSVSMIIGIMGCLILDSLPLSGLLRYGIRRGAEMAQPALIFTMLFLACCRIDYSQLRFRLWQAILLSVQGLLFVLLGSGAWWLEGNAWGVVLESAMLCAITPTATAAAVVASKLKGDMTGVITYTLLSNLLAAVALPLCAPLLHSSHIPFLIGFGSVMSRVVPMLLLPFLLAMSVRVCSPRLLAKIAAVSDLAFYLWCVCLPISIALAMRTLLRSQIGVVTTMGIAVASLIVCLVSFAIGRKVGLRYGTAVAGAQSLGQKNTAFGIWVAYTFLTPVTSVAGGFYAIWHNVYNAWQLGQERKREETKS